MVQNRKAFLFEYRNQGILTLNSVGYHGRSLQVKLLGKLLSHKGRILDVYQLVFHYDKDERLVKIYNQFFKATKELVLLRELKANRAIYDLFAFLIENFPNHQSQDKKDGLSYIKEAVDYCNLNLDKPIKVQEIADYLNLNRSYLARLFKQKTGVSLKQYLSHLRIENAKELLTKTELPVNVIACSIGFSDPLYFSKFFKKWTGYSPEKYRQVEVNVQNRQQ